MKYILFNIKISIFNYKIESDNQFLKYFIDINRVSLILFNKNYYIIYYLL